MLKAVGICLVLLACTFLGFEKSLNFSRRLLGLKELQRMCILLRGEISYRRAALPEALMRVAQKMSQPFSAFLEKTAKSAEAFEGAAFSEIFSREMKIFFSNGFFTKEDLEDFRQLGQYLGYMDITMQENTISLYLTELEQKIKTLSEELPVKRKLYQSMGILGGIFLAITFW